MNTILQKRIEEAADEYQNLVIEETKCHHNHTMTYAQGYEDARLLVKPTFIDAADWALQNQWISVEEALPDKGHEVLVAILNTKTNTHFFGFDAIVDDSLFLRDKNGFTIDVDYHKITHWAPIPSLKGGEK